MAYDPRVIRAISREATRRYSAGGFSRAERRKIRSAFLTGIVESGLRNLSYGDSDSQGWRQERASLYPNPTNVPASVRRYFNEADQHYRGQAPGRLSADVQRPAAQYRGRYGEHRAEGIRLLRAHVLGKGGSGGQGGSGRRRASQGVTAGPSVSSAGMSAPLSGIADPAVSSRRFLKLPEAGGEVPSSGPPSPNAPLSERLRSGAVPASPLALAPGVRAPSFAVSGGGREVVSADGDRYRWNGRGWVLQGALGGPGAPRRPARGPKRGGPRASLRTIAEEAQRRGLAVREFQPYDRVDPVHTRGSYHYRNRAMDVSGGSSQELRQFFRWVGRNYGRGLSEMFYDPMGRYWKRGRKVPGAIGGHGGHVHVAI